MPSPSRLFRLGKSVLLLSNRASSDHKPPSSSSFLFAGGLASLLRSGPFIGFPESGCGSSMIGVLGGCRSYRGGDPIEMKKGDWTCPECNFHNFARNYRCLECKAEGPKVVDVSHAEMKPGDWACPMCRYMNFSRNKSCKRCQEPSPEKDLKPGDWKCPACDFVNFSRNSSCMKCHQEGPNEDGNSEAESPVRASSGKRDFRLAK